jgi:hypothetical protein
MRRRFRLPAKQGDSRTRLIRPTQTPTSLRRSGLRLPRKAANGRDEPSGISAEACCGTSMVQCPAESIAAQKTALPPIPGRVNHQGLSPIGFGGRLVAARLRTTIHHLRRGAGSTRFGITAQAERDPTLGTMTRELT